MAPYPDEYLRPYTLSLADMNECADAALDRGDPDSVDSFIRLMIAGRLAEEADNIQRRVILDPWLRTPAINPADVGIRGDFDSLIGFTPRLPFNTPLSVSPNPNFKFTLKKPIHLTLPIAVRIIPTEPGLQ